MEILISDRQNDMALKSEPIEKLCTLVLKKEKVHEVVEVSISLVSADEMAQLNKHYRQIDKVTDVLSFSLNEEPPISHLLGDVVLCPVEASKKAKELSIAFNEYFGLLIIHALLHLLGYGHKHEMDAKVMSDKEKQLAEELGVANRSFYW